MKTVTELYRFFTDDLKSDLMVLEQARCAVAKRLYIIAAALGALAVVLVAATGGESALHVMIGGAFLFGVILHFQSRAYRCDFKEKVIRRIVAFIDPALVYQPLSHISQEWFQISGLFKHRIDRFKGDDHVTGTTGLTKMEFSELHAEYETRDNKGNRHHHTLFKGLFFMADFNKDFAGITYVLPDQAERVFGALGTMFQEMNKTRGQLIKLEDVEFEKEFAVYGTDQIEARYILSTSLMKRILDFKKKTGKRISLSFVGSRVFVAIPYRKNLFEPRVFHTLLDFEPIKEYFDDLRIALSIVEDLNLNTRIWTKQ
jgi:hypothetical protein